MMKEFDYPKVEILLATYNGEKYLKDQIKSILNQTYQNWNLLIRDDGSTDNTLKIINDLKNKYPDRVNIIEGGNRRLGACQNFHKLLKCSKAKYILFCDQDDIWLKDKIEISMKKILELEMNYGKNYPILIHTNMKLLDRYNNIISNSFWADFSINPEKMYIPEILFTQNIIFGCTILINESAKKVILPIPTDTVMHDEWISLKLVKYGKIAYIDTPTILYRQHGHNTVGVKKLGVFSTLIPNFISLLKNGFFFKKLKITNNLLGYEINILKAYFFLLVLSFERYTNKYKKKSVY